MIESKYMIGLAAILILYIAIKLFTAMNKNDRLYQNEIEQVLNSEEHQVKGRFEQ